MKLDLDLSSLIIADDDERSFTDDDYYIRHVRPNDYNCDLLLIVTEMQSSEPDLNTTTSEEEPDSVSLGTFIIPADKKILTTYIPYFDSLLSDDNNWFFYTSTDGQTKPAIEIKMTRQSNLMKMRKVRHLILPKISKNSKNAPLFFEILRL